MPMAGGGCAAFGQAHGGNQTKDQQRSADKGDKAHEHVHFHIPLLWRLNALFSAPKGGTGQFALSTKQRNFYIPLTLFRLER